MVSLSSLERRERLTQLLGSAPQSVFLRTSYSGTINISFCILCLTALDVFCKNVFQVFGAHVQTTKVYFLKSFSNQKTQNHLFHPQKYMFKAPQRPNITQNSHVILKRSCQFNPIEWAIIVKQFILSCKFKLLNIFLDTRCHQRGLGWKALSNE